MKTLYHLKATDYNEKELYGNTGHRTGSTRDQILMYIMSEIIWIDDEALTEVAGGEDLAIAGASLIAVAGAVAWRVVKASGSSTTVATVEGGTKVDNPVYNTGTQVVNPLF